MFFFLISKSKDRIREMEARMALDVESDPHEGGMRLGWFDGFFLLFFFFNGRLCFNVFLFVFFFK